MEAPCDLTDIIDETISALNIPEHLKEDAHREGHLAFCESRDIEAALRYWFETQ